MMSIPPLTAKVYDLEEAKGGERSQGLEQERTEASARIYWPYIFLSAVLTTSAAVLMCCENLHGRRLIAILDLMSAAVLVFKSLQGLAEAVLSAGTQHEAAEQQHETHEDEGKCKTDTAPGEEADDGRNAPEDVGGAVKSR